MTDMKLPSSLSLCLLLTVFCLHVNGETAAEPPTPKTTNETTKENTQETAADKTSEVIPEKPIEESTPPAEENKTVVDANATEAPAKITAELSDIASSESAEKESVKEPLKKPLKESYTKESAAEPSENSTAEKELGKVKPGATAPAADPESSAGTQPLAEGSATASTPAASDSPTAKTDAEGTTTAVPVSKMLELSCDEGAYTIDSDTLAVEWQSGEELIPVVDGFATTLQTIATPNGITGGLKDLDAHFEASLDGCVLRFSFHSNKSGELPWFALPKSTQALLLPFNEGMRVPTKNPKWRDYIINTYNGSDTTSGLKLPLWTQIYGDDKPSEKARYVNVVIENAFDNELNFESFLGQLRFKAKHRFTDLNLSQAMVVSYSIGKDALSGARRYRAFRETQGLSETLEAKAKNNPDILKLVGAPHVYLHGDGILDSSDVEDWDGLNYWFLKSDLRSFIREMSAKDIDALQYSTLNNYYLRAQLIYAINDGIKHKFPNKELLASEKYIEGQFNAAQERKSWLITEAGKYLKDVNTWGQGISNAHIQTLIDADIQHLWLGLNNWQAAFYQIDAVDMAKEKGWLISSYDSYNTGIQPKTNPSWITAHVPKNLRTACALINEDGTKVKGFKKKGVYLNPLCVESFAQHRMQEVIKFAHLNSLFLDADAAGMLREDWPSTYKKAKSEVFKQRLDMPQSQLAESFNRRLGWASERTVLGSEDGSAVTTKGISFAHGMETGVFGWGDKDMREDKSSPFYVGNWYPPQRPQIFFKKVAVKEPYRSLLFSPEFRVPLYQTVFHHELVNSHHWGSDNLKFKGIEEKRDLSDMLYVTAPMVHLSRFDLKSKNTKRVRALKHLEKGYSPLHKAVWNSPMESFEWLDEKGLVQKVSFANGSVVVANFGRVNVKYNESNVVPFSIYAELMQEDNTVAKHSWLANK